MVTSSGLARSAEATHAYPLVTRVEGYISVMLGFFGVEIDRRDAPIRTGYPEWQFAWAVVELFGRLDLWHLRIVE